MSNKKESNEEWRSGKENDHNFKWLIIQYNIQGGQEDRQRHGQREDGSTDLISIASGTASERASIHSVKQPVSQPGNMIRIECCTNHFKQFLSYQQAYLSLKTIQFQFDAIQLKDGQLKTEQGIRNVGGCTTVIEAVCFVLGFR